MVKIYDRAKKSYYEETQYGENYLNFLYHTVPGRILLRIAVGSPFSEINRILMDRKKSAKKIEPFVNKYKIRMSDFEQRPYVSYNDFFTRKFANGARKIDSNRVIAPADAKLLAFSITDDLSLLIKHSCYSLSSLFRDEKLAEQFRNGTCLVYRLTVDDCHRYCYIENGIITKQKRIPGVLHTVSSISNQEKIYTENKRVYSLIETKKLGKVVQMEVGAMLVGRIVNKDSHQAVKGKEKGYFHYGGSTIIVFYEEGKISVDEDILKHSQKQVETKVTYGEGVGNYV